MEFRKILKFHSEYILSATSKLPQEYTVVSQWICSLRDSSRTTFSPSTFPHSWRSVSPGCPSGWTTSQPLLGWRWQSPPCWPCPRPPPVLTVPFLPWPTQRWLLLTNNYYIALFSFAFFWRPLMYGTTSVFLSGGFSWEKKENLCFVFSLLRPLAYNQIRNLYLTWPQLDKNIVWIMHRWRHPLLLAWLVIFPSTEAISPSVSRSPGVRPGQLCCQSRREVKCGSEENTIKLCKLSEDVRIFYNSHL